nr:hypothetical protein [Candidatus Krumholzibacteria bacterium]
MARRINNYFAIMKTPDQDVPSDLKALVPREKGNLPVPGSLS